MKQVSDNDKLIFAGDFNARVGCEQTKLPGVVGSLGLGTCNSNGERLLAFYSEHNLLIINIIFKHKTNH